MTDAVLSPARTRDLLAFERSPAVLELARGTPGRIAILVASTLLLRPFTDIWPAIVAAIAVLTFADRRHAANLASVATLAIFAVAPNWYGVSAVVVFAEREGLTGAMTPLLRWGAPCLVLAFAAGFLALMRAGRPRWLARRPLTVLFAIYFGLLTWASAGPGGGEVKLWLWSLTAAFSGYVWFIALVGMEQRGAHSKVSLLRMLVDLHPFWGSTGVPYTLAPKKLGRVEAADPEAFAKIQLKGLKLLIWAYVLLMGCSVYSSLVHDALGIPSFHVALKTYLAQGLPWRLRWLSLGSDFFESVLRLAAMGHAIVGAARLAGYNLLRNTYRPFSSRSIAEFWGRYYYYFKEMLLNLFYFPAFFGYFRSQPRLRAAFATFMAAGVGNALFHFVREVDRVTTLGLWQALIGFQTYLFYCLVLSAGIVASQMHAPRKPIANPSVGTRVAAFARVMAFFCLLQVFDDTSRSVSLADHAQFFLSLFRPDW